MQQSKSIRSIQWIQKFKNVRIIIANIFKYTDNYVAEAMGGNVG